MDIPADEIEIVARTAEPSAAARALVQKLDSRDIATRGQARDTLVEMGQEAVPALVEALEVPRWRLRWEATRALSEIADPLAAPALAHRIVVDEHDDIRWLAEKGLIAMGERGLPALLRELIAHADSIQVQQGAYHVLHVLEKRGMGDLVVPVLDALGGLAPAVQAPLAAEALLRQLEPPPIWLI